MYTIKQVSQWTGLTPKALRLYDRMGLASPSDRSPAGYRLYCDEDLALLQQVLFYRELGFPLKEIKGLLAVPGFGRLEALRGQRQLFQQRIDRMKGIEALIDQTINAIEEDRAMNQAALFNRLDPEEIRRQQQQYADEVRRKYDPELVEESYRRTGQYSKEEFAQITAEQEALTRRLAQRFTAGAPADHPAVQEDVDAYRRLIDEKFYPCNILVFRGLAELYVTDERFTAYFEAFAPGFAAYLSQAMRRYCDTKETA